MDANEAVEIGLFRAQLQGDCESLCDFAGIRCEDVEAENAFLFSAKANQLAIAVRGVLALGQRELERLKNVMIDDDGFFAVLLLRVILGYSTTAVFERRKDSGWHLIVLCLQK